MNDEECKNFFEHLANTRFEMKSAQSFTVEDMYQAFKRRFIQEQDAALKSLMQKNGTWKPET